MKQKILYSAGLVITIYLNIMYPWGAGRIFLAGFLVLPFLCELSAWYLAIGTEVELACENQLLSEGEIMKISAKVTKQRKLFPATVKVILTMDAKNVVQAGSMRKPKREAKKKIITFSTETQDEKCLEIKAENPGVFRIEVQKILIRDVIGIGSARKSSKKTKNAAVSVTIMPETVPVTMMISENVWNFPLDSDEFSKTKGGDDVSEVFDVREYRPGDGMQKIHWKLSARQEKLWVKEYSFPIGAAIVLFAEGREDKDNAGQADFLRGFASFAQSLLEKGCTYYAAWEEKENHFPKRFLVSSEETYYEMLSAFLADSACGFGETIVEQYPDIFPERYCLELIWSENLSLRRGDECLLQLRTGESFREQLKDVLIEV